MSSIGSSGLDSLLLGYYQAQLPAATSSASASATGATTAATSSASATANDDPPWSTPMFGVNDAETAQVLSTTDFLNTTNVPLSAGATTSGNLEQDNQKLFSLYNAVNNLSYLSQLAQSANETSGQLAGLNTRFQAGLAQVQQYLSSTTFNNYALQAATPAASVTSTAGVGLGDDTFSTRQLVTDTNINNPLPGLSASDGFTINVQKDGTTTAVPIDLSQVQGGLTLGNIVSYINSQLSAGGFSTRFQKTESGGTDISDADATFGLQISPGGNETISLSAPSTPALYLAGDSGNASEVDTTTGTGSTAEVQTTPADQTGRLTKIGVNGAPTAINSTNQDASTGTTTAQATVVDSSGNIYVLGNATGDFGNQINQGTQDVYLTKYDSTGNQLWSQLVGSAGSASGYGMALDPAGGVVITGASTADLTTTSVADGNNDSVVASYDADGDQNWIQQIQTLATNQANAVSVDASGNIYIGGSVSGGDVGAGQTSQGGGDAYLAKLNSKGQIVAENQFGTSGADQVSATATGSDGSLYVASVQNGNAIVSKYTGGNINAAPAWSENLGALQAGGAIGGIAVSNGQIYVSGTTSNANLTAGGTASVANAATGGTDAFVFALTDNGSSATANHVSYVGTSGSDQGNGVTVGPDGTVYLAGTTMGTFAGQQRSVQNVTNAFATAINANGSVQWIQQYGGASGQSTGAAVAVDPNGASVLDALGLPRGVVNANQSVDLANQTTLRTDDSFQIAIEGTAARTATISIDPGETLDSVVTKINAQLGTVGKASIGFADNAENLAITVNPGQTINLIPGPADSDALARLGIASGVLSATGSASTASTSSVNGTITPTYGLGLTSNMDISTKTGADLARSTLLGVMSNIQNAYQTSNAPPPSTSTTPANTNTGTVDPETSAQLANYNLALSLLGGGSSNSDSDSSDSILSLF